MLGDLELLFTIFSFFLNLQYKLSLLKTDLKYSKCILYFCLLSLGHYTHYTQKLLNEHLLQVIS